MSSQDYTKRRRTSRTRNPRKTQTIGVDQAIFSAVTYTDMTILVREEGTYITMIEVRTAAGCDNGLYKGSKLVYMLATGDVMMTMSHVVRMRT